MAKPVSVTALQEYERAVRLPQLIRQLLQRAQAGDPDAAIAIYLASDECAFLKYRVKPPWLAGTPEDPVFRLRLDAYNKRQARCEGLQEIPELWVRPDQYRDLAAVAGHRLALAMSLTTLRSAGRGEEAQAIASSLISQIDAASFRYLYGYIVARNDGNIIGDPPERYDPSTFQAAWMMSSCQLGQPCGADSRVLRDICIYEGRCGYENYDEAARRFLNADQYQQAATLRNQILDALRNRRLSYFGLAPKAAPSMQ